MNIDKYLARIGLDRRDVRCDLESLRTLQLQHLLHVPFENLDIHWGLPIVLDIDRFYEKVVVNQRGGYCYELNGIFNELLKELGFHTHLVSARVYMDDNVFGPDFDHMAIVVKIGDAEYLADVGFGDFTALPLKIDPSEEQTDREGRFYVRLTEHGGFEVETLVDGKWTPKAVFGRSSHQLSEFAERNEFQQNSPDSHFTKGKICSILTAEGRKTLTDKSFIRTARSERTESAILSDSEFAAALQSEFGIPI